MAGKHRIDQAALLHKPAIIGEFGNCDLFIRAYDGSVEHFWMVDDGAVLGPEQLGGQFDSDPVVIGRSGTVHLIGRSGTELVSWVWNDATLATWLGTPDVVTTLPGFCLGDPDLTFFDTFVACAVTVEGWIKVYRWAPDVGWFLDHFLGPGHTPFTVPNVTAGVNFLDIFAIGQDGDLVRWSQAADSVEWKFESLGGKNLKGQPAVEWMGGDNVDIFVLNSAGVPVHWALHNGEWFKNETNRIAMGDNVGVDLQMTSWVGHLTEHDHGGFTDRIALFVRTTRNQTLSFFLEPPRGWDQDETFSDAVVGATFNNNIDILARTDDGGFRHDFFNEDPSLDGEAELGGIPFLGSWDSELLPLLDPDPPPVTLTLSPAQPDALVTRPSDMLLLGLRWKGFEVHDVAGAAPELHADGAATLTVYFPPQHVVEQVVDERFVPPAGFVAASALSGASRLTVELSDGIPISLTTQGVLDALRRGRVLPSEGLTEENTAIELPFRLIISPQAESGAITCWHAPGPIASPDGTVGLWQSHIRADGVAAAEPAGLTLQPLAAGSSDPFQVALAGGKRARILLEKPTARIDRLSLSALGGTLTAAGSWPGFGWEHDVALGRDRRVRISISGVMYPFGHRAEYVELTERVFSSTAEGAVAFLRKTRTLKIVEPVRREPADPHLRAAFPFSETEFTTTAFEHLDNPDATPTHPGDWETVKLQTTELQQLQMMFDQVNFEARQRYVALVGDMGPGADALPIEELAAGATPDANDLLDPDDPESVTRAQAAVGYLGLAAQARHIGDQIAALPAGGVAPLEVFFTPKFGGAPVTFPVRLAGQLGDVHVRLPMIFVVDVDREPAILAPAFHSLTDNQVATDLAAAYRNLGDGVVDVGGARIDMLRSAAPVPGDVCEVLRLHIVGAPHDAGFRPRLGAAPQPGETRPGENRWAFDTVLPALRTLLGNEQPPVRLALTTELLAGAPDVKVPFRMPDGQDVLATTFAQNSARSGGMAAPDVDIDGISRAHGPVNVDGLLSMTGPGNTLDPKKVLKDTATLLGYSLADLVADGALTAPPEMHTVTVAGQPPHAELQWHDVKLKDHAAFVGAEALLDLDVVVGTAEQTVKCTVTHFSLALPDPGSKLIEISMDEIKFVQTGTSAPALITSNVSAAFFGPLKLLEELGGAMKIGDNAPSLEVSSNGLKASYALPVPDVKSGVFLLTGLVFHAGIDIPFDNRPVTLNLGFASREKPFNLSVFVFGGGGYLDMEIAAPALTGAGSEVGSLRRLEFALEFGASVAVDFVVASGEVHAIGGARLMKNEEGFFWDAYLRFGGSVSVLGLVSVSVELCLTLTFEELEGGRSRLVGRATLVLDIDLTLFSDSVELDSGEWELIGSGGAPARGGGGGGGGVHPQPIVGLAAPDLGADLTTEAAAIEQWRRYRSVFAEGAVG